MKRRATEARRVPKSIVTKRGDGGETGLLYGGRVSKTDPRTEAYGCVDEAISALGLARASSRDPRTKAIVLRVQRELFTVGAELATDVRQYANLRKHFSTVTPALTQVLEREIAQLEAEVPLPRAFVVPGGTVPAAALDLARTMIRTAERRIVALNEAKQLHNPEVLRYMNRLSDLVFMLARYEEREAIEPLH
jgi:cob(I)alamin adenosyltransferase